MGSKILALAIVGLVASVPQGEAVPSSATVGGGSDTAPPKADLTNLPGKPSVTPAAFAPPGDALNLRPTIVEDLKPALRLRALSSGPMVQLGAWRAETDAAEAWNRLVGLARPLLGGLTPQIAAADVPGKGHFWRLRAAPPEGQSAADLCARLGAQGIACIAVK